MTKGDVKLNYKSKTIGYGFTNYHYAFPKSILELKKICQISSNVFPIMSFDCYNFIHNNKLQDYFQIIEKCTNHTIIHTLQSAQKIFDILIIAPCSGNTISKLAHGISDTPITASVKYNLINNRPIVIGICAIDGLNESAENIGKLLNKKNYYFVPFYQNNPITKPYSIMCNFNLIEKTLEYALENKQLNPILY